MPNIPTEIWVYAAVALVIIVAAVITLVLRPRKAEFRERSESEAAEREKERLAALARKGTHDTQGHRLCITCNDKVTRATQSPFVIVHDEGSKDLVRRKFGAPPRYRVEQKRDAAEVYCDQCAIVVRLEHEVTIGRFFLEHLERRRDEAVALRRSVLHGCNDVIATRIDQHDEQVRAQEPQPRRATVTPLRGEANGN